jgi:Flp pilus assembly protein TadD
MDGAGPLDVRILRKPRSQRELRRELQPLLEAVAAADPHGAADLHLAELALDDDPWRASLLARRVAARTPNDSRAWAVLGFAQTLLGNFTYARRAYERALQLAPGHASYAHNLGHLLDVALGQPEAALPWLEIAFEAEPDNPELAASYAHGLARAGQIATARRVLSLVEPLEERERMLRWLDRGAPRVRLRRTAPEPPRRRTHLGACRHALQQGLRRLPLDVRTQRAAHDILAEALFVVAPTLDPRSRPRSLDTRGFAAACAALAARWAASPLSLREVAAPFGAPIQSVRTFVTHIDDALRIE